MRTTSPVDEITALVNLAGGKEDVKNYLLGALRAEHFGVPASQEVFNRISNLVQLGKDVPTIRGLISDLTLAEESRDLIRNYKKFERLPSISAAKDLVHRLDTYRKARICYDCTDKTLKMLQEDSPNIDEVISVYESSVENAQIYSDTEGELLHIGEECNAHKLVLDILEGRTTSFIPTGFKAFDRINGGFRRGSLVAIAATTSGGKAQPLYSLIKVPNRWVKMSDIKIGDVICTPDGSTAPVTDIFPQGLRHVYRVIFEDGRTTDCDINHLWKVYPTPYKKCCEIEDSGKILSLEEITVHYKNVKTPLYIQLPLPVFNNASNLPLDPHILGLLLNTSRKGDRYSEALKYFRLQDEKFIPEMYKEASVVQRLELLKGLVDADEGINYCSDSTISISTSSYRLAYDIQYLVRSLGGLCTIKKQDRSQFKCHIKYSGSEILGSSGEEPSIRIEKIQRCKIKDIKYLGLKKTQCIAVDHPDHLYITNDFVVTHNSCAAIQLLINIYRAKHRVALVSLEMDHEEILSRILSNIAKVDSLDILLGRLSEKQKMHIEKVWNEFSTLGVQNNCKYSIYTPIDDLTIKETCYRLARYNYDILVVDYVSLLDTKGEEPWKALGEIARFMKRYIKKMNMVGVLLCQLNEENKIRYARAIKEHSDNVWSWIYNREVAEETGHIITIDQQKARNQCVFPFRVNERFNYMSLTDCEEDLNKPSAISGSIPTISEFNIEDDLEF